MVKPSEFTEGIYIFKVSIASAWRRIPIPASSKLDRLSDIILAAFNFDVDHLYLFSYKSGSLTCNWKKLIRLMPKLKRLIFSLVMAKRQNSIGMTKMMGMKKRNWSS